MRSLRNLGISSWMAAALLVALTGCEQDGDDDGSGGGGGKSVGGVFSSFFKGGDGGGNGAGDPRPGDPGRPGTPEAPNVAPIEPTEVSCRQVCAAVLQCVGVVCGVELPAEALNQGVTDCVPGCVDGASAAELGAIARATQNQCAGLQQSAEFREVCSQIDGGAGEAYGEEYGEDDEEDYGEAYAEEYGEDYAEEEYGGF